MMLQLSTSLLALGTCWSSTEKVVLRQRQNAHFADCMFIFLQAIRRRKTEVKTSFKGLQRGEFPPTMDVSSYHTSGTDDANQVIWEMMKNNDFSPANLAIYLLGIRDNRIFI